MPPSPENSSIESQVLAAEDALIYERYEQHACLRINRPAQRNALTNEVVAGLRAGLAMAKADPRLRAVVIRGTGEEAFCAGGDLRAMGGGADAFAAHRGRSELTGLFRDLWELGKPTIARVSGFALAGGFGLAVACDIIIASKTASFGVPEIGVGLWPYMISVPLIQAMPPRQALRLMMTGERVGAEEGERLGFVTKVTEPDALDTTVDALIRAIAKGSPQAMALGRTAFYAVLNHDVDVRLRMLEAMLTVNLGMPDAAEGLAAFAEKRKPAWRPPS